MSWLTIESLFDFARNAAGVGVNWWIQSALLIAAGLVVGALSRKRGSAVQSAVYRTTLAAVLAAPLVTWGLNLAGVSGWSVEMPAAWSLLNVEPPAVVKAAEAESDLSWAAIGDGALAAMQQSDEPPTAERINAYSLDGAPIASGSPDDFTFSDTPPAIASPSLEAPAPPAQVPFDAAPVFTLHRFGVIAAAASAAWILVATALVARLAVAWRRLGRIRRRAAPADRSVQDACRELASQLRVAPPAVLRSPYLPSPCLTGLRRPAVLLPEASGDLPMRDVLAHELAHLSRGDCYWNLLRQLAGAALFFQPLMGRLSRRLEATAEEVCDDYVVHLGGDRRGYAHRLVDIAELSLAPYAPASVGMVSLRSMLGQRVARIMDTSRSLSTRVGTALLTIVLIGGLAGTFAAGLVGLGSDDSLADAAADERMEADSTLPDDETDEPTTDAESDSSTQQIRGRVVGPDGKPFAGATVLAAWVVPEREPPTRRHKHMVVAQVKSDADGGFELNFSKEPPTDRRPTYGWHIVAFSPGLGPAWKRDVHLSKDPSPTLQLSHDKPIRGRILDLEGRPMAGATVRIHALQPTQTEEDITQWIKDSHEKQIPDPMEDMFYNSGDERFAGRFPATPDDGGLASGSPALPADARTDGDGEFSFAGVGGNRLALLEVKGPTIAKTTLAVVTREMQPLVARALHVTPVHNGTFYGREFDFVAGPTQPIVGTVTDAETGQPLAGMEVRVGQLAGNIMSLSDFLVTRTDAQGRYRLVGAPAGGGHRIDAAPAVEEPYFPQHVEAPPTAAEEEEIVCDLRLRRGRWIEGRVTASDDGAPVEGATVQFLPLRSNKHAVDYPYFDPTITGSAPSDRFKTAADGSFRVLAIPGEGILTAGAPWERREEFCTLGLNGAPKHLLGENAYTNTFLPWSTTNMHALRELDVDASAEASTCDLQFTRGLTRTVKLVDAVGQPVTGARVLGRMFPPQLEEPLAESTVTLVGLRPGDERDVIVIHPERRIGKAVNLAAGEETTVVLEPCAIARGRVIDEDAAPLEGVKVGVTVDHPDNWSRALITSATDKEGRFEALLPPGTVCRVSHYTMSGPNFFALCDPQPGAVFELGDLRHEVELTKEQTTKLMVAAPEGAAVAPGKAEVDDDLITVRGQVVAPDRKPGPNADVYVLRWYWNFGDHKALATTRADANGRFDISYRKSQFVETAGRPNQWRETYIASFADGYGPGWAHYDRLKPGEEAVVKLAVDNVPIEGRVIDLEGNPVVGATIEVGNIAEPKGGSLDAYLAAIKSGQAISTAYRHIDESLPHSDVQPWPKVVTDADGRFRLTGLGRERRVILHVSGPTIVTKSIDAATRIMEPIVHPAYDYKDADDTTQYGAQIEYTAAPSRVIEGVVRDAKTGEAIADAEIWSWKFAGEDISGITTVKTKSGADGRYRLEGMPKGDGNEIIVVPTDLPYFVAEFDVPNPPGTEPAPLDVELHRGVWVTGRVTDKATGEPVSAQMHYIAFPDNKLAHELPEFIWGAHGMRVQDRFRTDASGNYRVVALPGHGIIGVKAVLKPYPGGQGYHDIKGVEDRESFMKLNSVFAPTEKDPTAVKEIHIENNAAESVCNFELDAGGRVTLRTVDPDGTPLTGVLVTGVNEIDGNMDSMAGAEFDLVCFRPGENRTVLLYQPERRLGKSLRVKQEEVRDQPLTIELQPVGAVLGRLVNDGEPVTGASLRIDVAGDNDYGRELRGTATDGEGRFRQEEILPGLKYSIFAEAAGMDFTSVAKELEIGPGETVNLGTIDIAVEERPEPMRSGRVEAKTQAEAAPAAGEEAQRFAGSVVTPDGKPAAEADLYLVFHIPQPTGLLTPSWNPVGRTDAKGEFQLTVNPRDFGVGVRQSEAIASSLVAVKDGYGFAFASSGLYESSGAWREMIRGKLAEAPAEFVGTMQRMLADAGEPLQLTVDEAPLRGRVVDINGQPVPGVKLTLLEIWTGESDDLTAWRAAAKEDKADYYSARTRTPRSMNGPQVRSIVRPTATDADGRFTMRGIGRGRIAELLVEGLGVESAKIFARTEAGEPIVLLRERRSPDLGEFTYHPAEFTYVAGPSVPIEGVVRDAETKQPMPGITVKSQARHGERINGWGQDFVRAVTDAEGRYRLTGMPVGEGNRIAAIAPNDEPYFSTSARAATRGDQQSLEVNFDMPRGVWIEGRITDRQTGRGLPGQLDYAVSKDNPQYEIARSLNVDERDRLQADDNGRFRIVGLPGPGFVTFMAFDHQDYPRSNAIIGLDGTPKTPETRMLDTGPSLIVLGNSHAVAEVNPAADDQRYELNLQLDGGKIVGHVVDETGRPVTDFMYSGRIAAFGTWQRGSGDAFELVGYDAAAPRRVLFAHAERKLAGVLSVDGESPENLVARLQPAGKVLGRLVDDDGTPLPDMMILPWSPPMSSPAEFARAAELQAPPLPPNFTHKQSGEYETDAEGRFEIACLAPGIEYRLRAFDRASMTPAAGRAPKISGPIDALIVVEPGQTLDLGEVKLADREDFGSTATASPAASATSPVTTAVPAAESPKASSIVRGRVTGPDGKPVAGAAVAVTAMKAAPRRGDAREPQGDVLGESTTEVNGSFAMSLTGASSKTHKFAMFTARAEGAAIAWHKVNLEAPVNEFDVSLPPASPVAFRLVDIEGQPADGARVEVSGVLVRVSPEEEFPNEDGVGFINGPNTPKSWFAPLTADDKGRIEIPHVAENCGVSLKIAGDERFAPQDLAINTGQPEQRGERDGTYRPLVVNGVGGDGATSIPLAPAQLFTGTVTYEDTEKPAPHARVIIWASQQEKFGSMSSVTGQADAQGRYRISPNPGVRFGVTAYPPDGTPYLARSAAEVRWQGGEKSREVDVTLPRGVLVRGHVVESGTSKPVAGASVQYVPERINNTLAKNDLVTGWQGIQITGDDGRFDLAVLPGPGRLLAHGPEGEYVLQETSSRDLERGQPGGERNYAHAVQRIDPAAISDPQELTISLERGVTVIGELVDPAGAPIDQAVMVTRLTIRPFWIAWQGQPVEVIGGHFEVGGLSPGREAPIHFLDARRKLGATLLTRAGMAPPRLVMQPCGKATMRFVDDAGRPVAEHVPQVQIVVTPGVHEFSDMARQAGTLAADADFIQNTDRLNHPNYEKSDAGGRMELAALIPGATYRVASYGDGGFEAPKDFVAEAGKTIDLGDIVVQPPR